MVRILTHALNESKRIRGTATVNKRLLIIRHKNTRLSTDAQFYCFSTYLYERQVLVAGNHLLLREFVPYGTIFMIIRCYNCCHGNYVKGIWALWDNCKDRILACNEQYHTNFNHD
jgi:hypothetical protein